MESNKDNQSVFCMFGDPNRPEDVENEFIKRDVEFIQPIPYSFSDNAVLFVDIGGVLYHFRRGTLFANLFIKKNPPYELSCERKFIRFWLSPGDLVLFRASNEYSWTLEMFCYLTLEDSGYPELQYLPFCKDTEYLLGTSESPKGSYNFEGVRSAFPE